MISHLGRYEITGELGRGAMGIVYKAHDPLIERFVAIKTINLQTLPEKERESYEARFYQEAKAAGHLNHPNIVTIHDLGRSGDMAYIAMELMEGRELQAILDSGKRLLIEEVLNIAIQVANGLFYAHQRGIVHRDIKPSNIMVLGDNRVKIADFGIARISSSMSVTKSGMIIGSPLYMSPEQIQNQSVTARSDIFSLGIVLYQMLTGRLPFSGDNVNSVMFRIVNEVPPKPSLLNPEIPDALDQIVSRCLAKKPDNRYVNADKLADDLRSCRDKLLHDRAGLDHPLISNAQLKHLRRLTIPGAVSQNSVVVISYLAIALIFMADIITPSTIQFQLFYIFPLILISFHCERLILVKAAVILTILLQSFHLLTDGTLPIYSRCTLTIMVLLTNVLVAYVSRVARANFLEVGHLASFDGLTGLRNRLSFESITNMEVERQRYNGSVLSFAHIDLDNFRELNESRGFAVGDQVLKLIANSILQNVRKFDTAARIGGDEFAILMPNTELADCESFCKQISDRIAKVMEDKALPVSISIGYVTFNNAPASISEIFHKAENAMFVAHASGKWHVYGS
jgi:diguanylate cyclase (GGDEF)-like protein